MSVKLSSVRANLARESEGDWVDIPDLPGVRLKVRGFAYEPYVMARRALETQWAKRYGLQPVPVEVDLRENGRLYAEHILLDWDGFDVAYDREGALATLTDPAYRALHDHIRYAGIKVAQTDVEFTADAAKN